MEHISELVSEVSSGNAEAFSELYITYYKRLINFSYTFLHSSSHAEEVVSDLFFDLWNKRENLRKVRNFNEYIYRSVHNRSLNMLKSAAYKNVTVDLCTYSIAVTDTPSDAALEYQELNNALSAAINQLPARCKLIFKMFREDELHQREIATILGLSTRTVEAQIAIATRRIREVAHLYIGDALEE